MKRRRLILPSLMIVVVTITICAMYTGCKKKETAENQPVTETELDLSLKDAEATPIDAEPGISPRAKMIREVFEPDKYTYVLFYDKSNTDSVYMTKIIDFAVPKIKPKANVVKIDREDPNNKDILELFKDYKKFEVPLTILYMPDRYPIRFFKGLISADALVNAIPSPIHEKVIQAYRHKQMGVVCFFRESMDGYTQAETTCRQAIQQFQGRVQYFKVNMDDPNEQNFMWKMNIPKEETVPTIVIVNQFGKGDRRLKGKFTLPELVKAIRNEMAHPTR